MSRLNDGICDCCDGADEMEGICNDNCEEVLREEREARAKLERNFQDGSKKRKEALEAFQALRSSKLKELEEKEAKISELDKDITAVQGQIRDLKQGYAKSRMATMKDEVVPGFDSLLTGLDRKEIQALIVHSCQVAGEILASSQHDNTCVALRMAGLDMALTWSDDDFVNIDSMKGEIDATMEWINLLFENASNGGRLNWRINNAKKKGKNDRRRLDEVFDDDVGYDPDMHDHDMEEEYRGYYDEDVMDDEYPGYDGTDDYIPDRDYLEDDTEVRDNKDGVVEDATEGKEKEFMDKVKATKFSSTRIAFSDHSKELGDKITAALDTPPLPENDDEEKEVKNDAEENEVKDDQDTEVESESNDLAAFDTVNFDPAAYHMVRSELRKVDSGIRKGLQWAASAMLLFEFSEQSDDNLKRLAVGTLYYGKLGAIEIWQILQSIVPEYSTTDTSTDDTCASPWATTCPPKVLSRNDGTENFPPDYILRAGQKFCDEEVMTLNSAMAESCSAAAESSSSSSSSDDTHIAIPTSIPNGYYGYSKPSSRAEDDPISPLFAPIDSLPIDRDGIQELESKKRDLEKEKRDIQREIDNGWKDVGGKEGTEMGPDGELHSLADQCFSVDAGKYTYETCIFGKATQRDIGQKAGGTGLGDWKGIFVNKDEDNDGGSSSSSHGGQRRVMKWDGGIKCWNGPQRSATVHVTCGAETKLISADEPDTCRYVMQMESHIACDDAYRIAHGL
jgi:Glucosidase II beta subunit-like protein/Glucosidase II beta subunit-like